MREFALLALVSARVASLALATPVAVIVAAGFGLALRERIDQLEFGARAPVRGAGLATAADWARGLRGASQHAEVREREQLVVVHGARMQRAAISADALATEQTGRGWRV